MAAASRRISSATEAVSVIIPHGGEGRLPSLRATLANLNRCEDVGEIIVVELGKLAYAEKAARHWGDKYVFSHAEGAFNRARALNLGLRLASHDLVLWLDNDIILPRDFLRNAVAELRSRTLDFLVPAAAVRYLSPMDSDWVRAGLLNAADCKPVNTLLTCEWVVGAAGLATSAFLRQCGGLCEGFQGWGGEDNAWLHKAALLGRSAITHRQDQEMFHLYHPLSGGYGGVAQIEQNPHYQQNVELLTQILSVQTQEEFLARFPSPVKSPCPWNIEKTIGLFASESDLKSARLARRVGENLKEWFGAKTRYVQQLRKDIESGAPQLDLDAMVFVGHAAAREACLYPPVVRDRPFTIAFEANTNYDSCREHTGLDRFSSVVTTDISCVERTPQRQGDIWWCPQERTLKSQAHSLSIALIQPLSLLLSGAKPIRPGSQLTSVKAKVSLKGRDKDYDAPTPDRRVFESMTSEGDHSSPHALAFDSMYREFIAAGLESVSGPGSSLIQTQEIRRRLPRLVARLRIASFLDLPCGDLNWMSKIKLGVKEYLGGDLLPQIIAENQRRHGGPGRRFVHIDLLRQTVPKADLILCRDCLVHLSYDDIFKALWNFKRSGSAYLLTTTFTARSYNTDAATGGWRTLNLEKEPFYFPPPRELIVEKCTEWDGRYADKTLGLWRLGDVRL